MVPVRLVFKLLIFSLTIVVKQDWKCCGYDLQHSYKIRAVESFAENQAVLSNAFSSKSLKCSCNLQFLGQHLLHSPAKTAPAAAACFQCSWACLGGGVAKFSRQHLHELKPGSSAPQGHPEP